ncbi:MAG: C-GCAxxG-C-C family protein [Tannerellaceae bacterium]|nr:C-GCAxxG-C-C family protein [Tannerellaceae bacterium]
MEKEQILEQFSQGFDCSQVVLAYLSEKHNLTDQQTARKMSACFGGGMWGGNVCGAVTGAYMALGLKYGHSTPGAAQEKQQVIGKIVQFNTLFEEKYGSTLCRKILGYKFPEDMEQILASGLLTTRCPQIVADAIEAAEKCIIE